MVIGVFEEVCEGAIAEVGLVEGGFFSFHGVFDHGGVEDFVVFAAEGFARFDEEDEDFAFSLGELGQGGVELGGDLLLVLFLSFEVFVVDEFVAVIAEEVGGGAFHAESDDVSAVFLEFGDEWGEIGIA